MTGGKDEEASGWEKVDGGGGRGDVALFGDMLEKHVQWRGDNALSTTDDDEFKSFFLSVSVFVGSMLVGFWVPLGIPS